jgi:hypothetical protein
MAKGLVRSFMAAAAVAGGLLYMMSGNDLEDAKHLVDLGAGQDGHAFLVVEDDKSPPQRIVVGEDEVASLAAGDNYSSLTKFTADTEQNIRTGAEDLISSFKRFSDEAAYFGTSVQLSISRDPAEFELHQISDLVDDYGAVYYVLVGKADDETAEAAAQMYHTAKDLERQYGALQQAQAGMQVSNQKTHGFTPG